MRLFHTRLWGAAVLAALLLATPAGAQETGDEPLSGELDFEPPLDTLGLHMESEPGLSAYVDHKNVVSIGQQGLDHRAEIRQTGSAYGAFASVAQSGSGNAAELDQCACGNLAAILQDGAGNLSGITQQGAGNVLIHRQYGNGLAISVTQYGGAQIAITQSRP